jgi:acyl-CoA reductase-like NAD-dependent aldehyde dehydrogenase
MKKVQLEMGGKNPMVVLDDADLDAPSSRRQQRFFSTGQRCTASSRLIVTEGIHDRFVEPMKPRMATLKVGRRRARPAPKSARSSTRSSSTRTWNTSPSARAKAPRCLAGGEAC